MPNRQSALSVSEICIDDIVFGKRKGNRVPLYYKKRPLLFQTPFLKVQDQPRFLNEIMDLTTKLDGSSKEKLDSLFELIEGLEDKVTSLALNNPDWFNVENLELKPLVKNKNNRPDTFYIRWPVPLHPKLVVVPGETMNYNPQDIQVGDKVRIIAECSHVWIEQNVFGLQRFQ